ncbi:glutamine--fructose-6-phosphate transaminase (isomerizing) [bacterium]|nr:glutamine--fructose-6-phosphate transaminase (isomerizing) [bacterium]|tara:strand:- start:36 stop:1850 length:1815 start_codon:yes stop_codon:yes gene_type:complete
MCGIFGYVGSHTASPILLEGLRTLEYRGYDSAGIFIPGSGVVKAVGPIDNLAKKITDTIPGTSGIAHTRWATHGAPTEANAHPHKDQSENVFVVHNGIIENYSLLKESLKVQGITFETDTDTEVLAKLIGVNYHGDLLEAVKSSLQLVQGTYGLAVMSDRDPDKIVVARLGSPLVIGIGKDGHLVASDPSALVSHTKDVVYLNDGDIAVIEKDQYSITTLKGENQNRKAEKIEWDLEEIKKDGYDHYLLKEIMEIPTTVENTIRGRLISDKGRVKLGGLEGYIDKLTSLHRLTITACGSAAYAGEVGRYIFEEYADLPVSVELASEYRYRTSLVDPKSAILAVSQSGETADTLAAIRLAKKQGLNTFGIVNVVGSTIARENDAGVYNHAGPEVSIASTKAVISQVVVMAMMSVLIGRERKMSLETGKEIVQALVELPNAIKNVLEQKSDIEAIAKKYKDYRDFVFMGRNAHFPIALEGALKLKEVTYIHAEGYAGGELKHGPIAMLDKNFPVVAFAPQDHVYEKMVSNIEEIKARGAPVLVIANTGDDQVSRLADDVIYVPRVHSIVQPIVSVIPTYLLAYYIGIAKDLNVDRPRNLTKSVTVE